MSHRASAGEFSTVVAWHDSHGTPVFTALVDLGDRNPVQSIAIVHGKVTVVYLTRTADGRGQPQAHNRLHAPR